MKFHRTFIFALAFLYLSGEAAFAGQDLSKQGESSTGTPSGSSTSTSVGAPSRQIEQPVRGPNYEKNRRKKERRKHREALKKVFPQNDGVDPFHASLLSAGTLGFKDSDTCKKSSFSRYDQAITIGGKSAQEDRLFFHSDTHSTISGVLDGHGGGQTSSIASKELPRFLYENRSKWLDDASSLAGLIEDYNATLKGRTLWSGATLTFVIDDDQLDDYIIGQLGDSFAIALIEDGHGIEVLYTHSHSPENEVQRLAECGSQVIRLSGAWRLTPALVSVSRSLGDFDKKPAVSSQPFIYKLPKEKTLMLGVFSDGAFDFLDVAMGLEEIQALANLMWKNRMEENPAASMLKDFQKAEYQTVVSKNRRFDNDNCSISVIKSLEDGPGVLVRFSRTIINREGKAEGEQVETPDNFGPLF